MVTKPKPEPKPSSRPSWRCPGEQETFVHILGIVGACAPARSDQYLLSTVSSEHNTCFQISQPSTFHNSAIARTGDVINQCAQWRQWQCEGKLGAKIILLTLDMSRTAQCRLLFTRHVSDVWQCSEWRQQYSEKVIPMTFSL